MATQCVREAKERIKKREEEGRKKMYGERGEDTTA